MNKQNKGGGGGTSKKKATTVISRLVKYPKKDYESSFVSNSWMEVGDLHICFKFLDGSWRPTLTWFNKIFRFLYFFYPHFWVSRNLFIYLSFRSIVSIKYEDCHNHTEFLHKTQGTISQVENQLYTVLSLGKRNVVSSAKRYLMNIAI